MDNEQLAAHLDAIDTLAKTAHRHTDTPEKIALQTGAIRRLAGIKPKGEASAETQAADAARTDPKRALRDPIGTTGSAGS